MYNKILATEIHKVSNNFSDTHFNEIFKAKIEYPYN